MARHTIDESIKEVTFDFKYNKKQFDALMTPATEVLFGGAKGSGKLQILTTQVLTSTGWKMIKDIHPGDYVFGEDGIITRVVAESEIDTEEDTYEVIFDDGSKAVVGARHEWYTQTLTERNSNKRRTPEFRDKRRASRPSRAKTEKGRPGIAKSNSEREHTYDTKVAGGIRNTVEISKTLRHGKMNAANHTIPIAKALQYPEQELEIPPYVLGAWAGDGSTNSGGFTGIDPEIWERFEELGYEMTHYTCEKAHRIHNIVPDLDKVGVLHRKHIPLKYKMASYEQRLELVKGMMDTDGTIDKNGNCALCLSDETLANDMLEVIRSLGIKCTQKQRPAYLYGVRKKDRYRMNFTTTVPVFHLSRKKERLPTKVRPTTQFWYIIDVVKVKTQPKKCIQVDNESHLYLIGKNLIPTHNSYLARQAAVTYAFNIPGLQVYIFRESYSEVKRNYLYGADGLEAILKQAEKAGLCSINSSEPRIHFYNGSDIYLRHMNTAQDVEQIRGNDVHVLIADEAAQWLIRDIYNQLRTCMRCSLEINYDHLAKIGMDFVKPGFFPRALLLSNPGGVAHTFIRDEFITNMPPNTPVQMEDEDGGMIREFIPAFLSDNSILLKRDPKYRAKLLGSGKHVRAMLEGDWNGAEGSALYDEWDTRYNLMAPFKVPSNARIKRCFDWGIAKPYAATYVWETRNDPVDIGNGIVKVFPAGTMIVVGEKYGWNGRADEGCKKTAKEVGAELKKYEMLQPWCQQIMQGPSDGSIFNATHNDKTINDEIVWGFNHYSDGTRTSTYYRESLFIRADRSKGSRAKGLALVKSYLRSAHDQEINGEFYPSEEPGLIFFTTCVRCIATLPSLPFDKNDPDDIDTKSEDHLYDTIRYAVLGKTESFTPLTIQGI